MRIRKREMKTLGEVINFVSKKQEYFDHNGCYKCHYCGEDCISGCIVEDTMKYLKEYQTTRQQLLDGISSLEKSENQFIKSRNAYKLALKELKINEK